MWGKRNLLQELRHYALPNGEAYDLGELLWDLG